MWYIPALEVVTASTTDSPHTPTTSVTPGLNPEMSSMETQLKARVSELKQISEMPHLEASDLKALEDRIQKLLSEIKSLAAENPQVHDHGYKTIEAELQKQLSGMKAISETVQSQDEKIKGQISDLQETLQENTKTK